jgi:spermidine/putrescine transport system ATP-binding protein
MAASSYSGPIESSRARTITEPLGALDAKLRKTLQLELKTLQERVGITFVHVTHDQEEAPALSDRLAVMNQGRVEQVGAAEQVYQEPASAYVADFLGVANLMAADAEGPAGEGRCRVRLGEFQLDAGRGETGARGPVKVVIRPERVQLEPQAPAAPTACPAWSSGWSTSAR